jgi:hypothetical protein
MLPTWIVTCACGCVSAAETTEELMWLLDTHRPHASPAQLHTVTLKGQLAVRAEVALPVANMYAPGPMATAQMISVTLSTGLLPRQDEIRMFGGYGTGAPCSGCGLPIRPTDVEYELVFADERSFVFHPTCANLWRVLKDAPGGDWRVTCSCKEWNGYAATLAEAEELGCEHIAVHSRRSRHVIAIARN